MTSLIGKSFNTIVIYTNNPTMRIKLLLPIAAAFFIAGCSVYTDISVTADQTASFDKYKTFAWLQDKIDTTNTPYNNDIIRNNIRNYFGQSFIERGYTVNLDTPDLLLHVVINNKKREKEVLYPSRPYSYYYCRYYYCSRYYFPYRYEYYYKDYPQYCTPSGYCTEKIEYVEGAITLNVIDRVKNKLIWSGVAKGDIYDPKYINDDIHPAIKRIMKKFPMAPIEYKNSNTIKNSPAGISSPVIN